MFKNTLLHFWRKWWFGLALGGLMVLYEVIALIAAILLTPHNMVWLGDLVFNSADYPVYLNYLAQGLHSHVLNNLYNNLPQISRFDAFWSTGGLLVRFGLSPIQSHELLRWLGTFFLGYAIYSTAKWSTKNEHQARIGSFILLSGMGLGWLYGFAANLITRQFLISIPPDISSQFGTAPILLGGAHMIFSLALQILLIRWVWQIINNDLKKYLLVFIPLNLFFTAFHPYYIPLIGLISIITLFLQIKKNNFVNKLISFLVISISILPSAFYFIWLAYKDNNFNQHFLIVNQLNLHKPIFWIICLIPFFIASFWMKYKTIPEDFYWNKKPNWVFIWIIAAIFCILLPFPWLSKYTQGLLLALALTTLPFWLHISNIWLSTNNKVHPARIISYALFLSMPFLYLLFIQINLANSELKDLFYQPQETIHAFNFIQANTKPNEILLIDDINLGLWAPALAMRTTWIGHEHETPNYWDRDRQLQIWRKTNDKNDFNDFLDKNNISILISNNEANISRYSTLIKTSDWSEIYQNSNMVVWHKNARP